MIENVWKFSLGSRQPLTLIKWQVLKDFTCTKQTIYHIRNWTLWKYTGPSWPRADLTQGPTWLQAELTRYPEPLRSFRGQLDFRPNWPATFLVTNPWFVKRIWMFHVLTHFRNFRNFPWLRETRIFPCFVNLPVVGADTLLSDNPWSNMLSKRHDLIFIQIQFVFMTVSVLWSIKIHCYNSLILILPSYPHFQARLWLLSREKNKKIDVFEGQQL